MKLLIVMASGYCHGGAEKALLDFIRERAKSGIEIVRIIFLEDGELCSVLHSEKLLVSVVKAGRLRQVSVFIQTLQKIRKLFKADQPDLILAWMTKSHIYSGLAATGCGIPTAYFQMGLPDGGVVDRLSRLIPAVGAIGCSAFVAQKQANAVRHKVVGIPLAVDLDRFECVREKSAARLKRELGLEPSQPLVGIVARLQYWKGQHVFVDAMVQVFQHHPEVRGLIVGGPFHLEKDYAAELYNRIDAQGLNDRIHMVGEKRNIPDWMQAMDVIVHTSEREPFGIVVLEAMSLGKPVIASRPGGPEEIITHGKNGLLVKSGDASQLAEAILKFLEDPELASACGRRAAARAREFSPAAFARNLGEALRELVQEQ